MTLQVIRETLKQHASSFSLYGKFVVESENKIEFDASAYYDSPCGRIESKWKKRNGSIELTVTVPDSIVGKTSLPKGNTS